MSGPGPDPTWAPPGREWLDRREQPVPEAPPPAVPSASVQTTMHEMTDQLQTIIDAAERAADAIRLDAEERARRHLVEAQRRADELTAERVGLISELTDDLIRHATMVKEHSEQMLAALEAAIGAVTGKLDPPGHGAAAQPQPPPPPPPPQGAPAPPPSPPAAPPPVGSPAPIPPPASPARGPAAGGGWASERPG